MAHTVGVEAVDGVVVVAERHVGVAVAGARVGVEGQAGGAHVLHGQTALDNGRRNVCIHMQILITI